MQILQITAMAVFWRIEVDGRIEADGRIEVGGRIAYLIKTSHK